MSEGEFTDKLWRTMGPAWYRPFKRRKWRKLRAALPESGHHWADLDPGDQMATRMAEMVQPICDELSRDLPDGLTVVYDIEPLVVTNDPWTGLVEHRQVDTVMVEPDGDGASSR